MTQTEAEARPTLQRGIGAEDHFDLPALLTVSAAHAAHDLYPPFVPQLLPLLIAKLGIPLAAAGALVSISRAGSLLQPFFGVLADRTDSRYFVIATPMVTGLAVGLLGRAADFWTAALVLLVAGVSIAAFHPAATAIVTQASGRSLGRGTSFNMAGGKLGFAAGPLLIVSLITWFGLEGSYVGALPGALASVVLYLLLRKRAATYTGRASMAGLWQGVKAERKAILLLSGLVLLRSTSLVGISTFYPTYVRGMGASLLFAGLAMTVYESAGFAGTLAGGTLSDRIGRRRTLLLTQLATGPMLYLAVTRTEGPEALLVLVAAGIVAAASSPVELTLFQELLPVGRSTAAGIWYLLSFDGSIVATLAIGVVADWIGLGPALRVSVFASMLSLPLILALPRPRKSL